MNFCCAPPLQTSCGLHMFARPDRSLVAGSFSHTLRLVSSEPACIIYTFYLEFFFVSHLFSFFLLETFKSFWKTPWIDVHAVCLRLSSVQNCTKQYYTCMYVHICASCLCSGLLWSCGIRWFCSTLILPTRSISYSHWRQVTRTFYGGKYNISWMYTTYIRASAL